MLARSGSLDKFLSQRCVPRFFTFPPSMWIALYGHLDAAMKVDLEKLSRSYRSIQRLKALSGSFFCWPSLVSEIANYPKVYSSCGLTVKSPLAAISVPWTTLVLSTATAVYKRSPIIQAKSTIKQPLRFRQNLPMKGNGLSTAHRTN